MSYSEIDEGENYTGLARALELVNSNVKPVGIEELPLDLCNKRVLAENLSSLLDNPSSDVSLKDGFAVRYEDVAAASSSNPVCLKNIGSAFAGTAFKGEVPAGCAVNICSGAPIPPGADTVIANELCEATDDCICITKGANKGQNILAAAADLRKGEELATAGCLLLPGDLGLIASAGIARARVYRKPRVAVIAIGISGSPAAFIPCSFMPATGNYLRLLNCSVSQNAVVKDDKAAIRTELEDLFPVVDAILTSGGQGGDLTVGILDELMGRNSATSAWERN